MLDPDLAIIACHIMASSGVYWAMVVTLSCGMPLEIHEAFGGEKRTERDQEDWIEYSGSMRQPHQ